ncbi:MAG: DUF86 domain-containing protein [Erysipelotrichaceae bacterium]|nr:DUF86 domain-containing protein [Erysipelotrichaceae bacterium]
MDNIKNDKYYIDKALENINAIIGYTQGMDKETFVSEEMLLDAVMFRLVQMTENINRISGEYKEKHPEIPWGLIAGFRNGIVHDYGKTDYTIVYEIISSDIYNLKDMLER